MDKPCRGPFGARPAGVRRSYGGWPEVRGVGLEGTPARNLSERDLIRPVGPCLPDEARSVQDSRTLNWHRRPGLFLAIRYLRSHPVSVTRSPLSELPRLSHRVIRLALRMFPRFLDRADVTFPVIIAGRGWYQIALDGRHRISKAIWTGMDSLPSVRVPWWLALELLIPGIYEVEWLFLFLRKELRKAAHELHR